jgi:hypothetical protein
VIARRTCWRIARNIRVGHDDVRCALPADEGSPSANVDRPGPGDHVTFEELVAGVGAERYRAACAWAWQMAEGLGRAPGGAQWPEELAAVPHDMAEAWYDDATSLADRLDLALRLSAEMPCYATLMYMKVHFADLPDELRQKLWTAYRAALASDDPRVADPVSYVLWVDFFEDPSTVDEAWRETARWDLPPWHRRLRRVLDVAGPVPWPHKEALFEHLVGDPSWHAPIARALIGSAFDVYGHLDAAAARRWLDRLQLRDDVTGVPELRQKLGVAK